MALVALCVAVNQPAVRGAATCPDGDVVRQAVGDAVRARVGAGAEVQVTLLNASCAAESREPVIANADVGARAGVPARFALLTMREGRAMRIGEATVVANVEIDAIRTGEDLIRGQRFRDAELVVERVHLENLPLSPMPTLRQVRVSRATRRIPAGSLVATRDIGIDPAVEPGDRVRATVRMGQAEVSTYLVATRPAAIDETVTLVNPESHRTVRGRVVRPDEVEVGDAR